MSRRKTSRYWTKTGPGTYQDMLENPQNFLVEKPKPRFVPEHLLPELFNLWHLSRVPHNGRHDRLIWTSSHFAKDHDLSPTAVYKDLETLTKKD